MAYNQTKYKALRSLEVPHKIALALSDTSDPIGATMTGSTQAQANSTATDVPGVVTDLNALLTKLRARGVIS